MSTYQNILEAGREEGRQEAREEIRQEAEKKEKTIAKRLWLSGYNAVYIAEIIDIQIETMKNWLLIFEKEETDKKK